MEKPLNMKLIVVEIKYLKVNFRSHFKIETNYEFVFQTIIYLMNKTMILLPLLSIKHLMQSD